MSVEKRADRRINVSCKLTFILNEKQLVINGHTENISAGGVMVIIGEEIAPSTVVDLELFLWDKNKPLQCKGQIAWVNEITPKETKPRLFNTGIKFLDISDSDRSEVRDFVNTIFSSWQ
jgi:Tfp pilus assembly protein PilZ